MMSLDTSSFQKISQIIERDSKDTSYKFALIRSTVEVIQDFNQLITISDARAIIPTGLLIEKWIWYYYPLFESNIFIPQKNGEPATITRGKNVAFRGIFNKLIEQYAKLGGFQHFYQEYKKNSLSEPIYLTMHELVNELYDTITKMPMRYIGKSVNNEEYSIYRIESKKLRTLAGTKVNTNYLRDNFGLISIPEEYYLVLKYMGSFINGPSSLIHKWADFTLKANKEVSLSKEFVLSKLLMNPERNRDIASVKRFYQKYKDLYCVWSGKRINASDLNIDHVLPFTHYLNNDIWNLLPTRSSINNSKRDKVPSPTLIQRQSDLIVEYWRKEKMYFKDSFLSEAQISLLPALYEVNNDNWETTMLDALKAKAEFLITIKGLEEYDYRG